MIDAKDLRIGNWVIDRYTFSGDERFTKVVSLYFSDGYGSVNASTDKDYFPILLTPEILEKCGFKDNHTRVVGSENNVIEWECDDAEIRKEGDDFIYVLYSDDWGYVRAEVIVKYVHQLQNVHYAITENELTVTL